MQSSLTRVISSALVYSTRPPVSVYGTDLIQTPYEAFLGNISLLALRARPSSSVSENVLRIYLQNLLRGLNSIQLESQLLLCVPPSVITRVLKCRNINLLSIDYAFRPRLRVRLTLGGLTFPRNPWTYGDRVFHPIYRYSCRHNLFCFVQVFYRSPFDLRQNAPLPLHSKWSP